MCVLPTCALSLQVHSYFGHERTSDGFLIRCHIKYIKENRCCGWILTTRRVYITSVRAEPHLVFSLRPFHFPSPLSFRPSIAGHITCQSNSDPRSLDQPNSTQSFVRPTIRHSGFSARPEWLKAAAVRAIGLSAARPGPARFGVNRLGLTGDRAAASSTCLCAGDRDQGSSHRPWYIPYQWHAGSTAQRRARTRGNALHIQRG